MHKLVSRIIKCKLFNDTINMVNSHWQLESSTQEQQSDTTISDDERYKEYHKLVGK